MTSQSRVWPRAAAKPALCLCPTCCALPTSNKAGPREEHKGWGWEGLGLGDVAARPLACETCKESNVANSHDRAAAGSCTLFIGIRKMYPLCVNKAPYQGLESKVWVGFHPLPPHCAVNSIDNQPGQPCLPSTTAGPSYERGTEIWR